MRSFSGPMLLVSLALCALTGADESKVATIDLSARVQRQEADSSPMQRGLSRLMEEHRVPGMQYAVLQGSRVLARGNLGYANLEAKVPVSDATTFEIASVSKTMTGLAIRMLLNEGKLRLEDEVSRYVPMSTRWTGLKIRHLVGMSMGIGDDWTYHPWGDIIYAFDDATTLKSFDKMPQLFPMGRGHEYCSPAYAILGMVIESVTGFHYSKFLKRRVFDPAGMAHTSVLGTVPETGREALGYRKVGSSVARAFRISPYMHARADVGVRSTVPDLIRFMQSIDRRVFVKNPEALFTGILDDDGLILPYGYGWYTEKVNGIPYFYHGGLYRTGFRSMIMRFPRADMTFFIAMNNYSAPPREFVRELAHHLSPEVVVPD